MSLLFNAQGRPEPSPEVTRRLLELHPALFLRHFDAVGANWAICWAWPKTDARWATVQDGSTDPAMAFDIIGYLPMDCPLDAAAAYLERSLRTYPKEEIQRLADRMTTFNFGGGAMAALMDQAIGEVLDAPDPTGKTKVRRSRVVSVPKTVA